MTVNFQVVITMSMFGQKWQISLTGNQTMDRNTALLMNGLLSPGENQEGSITLESSSDGKVAGPTAVGFAEFKKMRLHYLS
jgi:hypothetical protein